MKDNRWWRGPSFLQRGEDEWPDMRFGEAPETYKEVKSEKWKQPVDNERLKGKAYLLEAPRSEVETRPDPTKCSKWYKIYRKGTMETGISLLQVVGWMNRIISSA